jgi:hypothetical protein
MARNRATAERAAPPLGIFASIALHVALVVILFVSFSKKIDLPGMESTLVPVDLVTVADQTNVMGQTKAEPEPPPDVPMTEPVPPDVAPPKVEIAPDAKPKPKEKEKFDPDRIGKLLAERQEKQKQTNAKTGSRDIKGAGLQNAMTADLVTFLQSMINPCWIRPEGVPHPERLIVKYRLFLNKDGTVGQPPQLMPETAAAVAGDPYMAAAAGAARRAIYACQPYKLPANRYSDWRDIVLTFDPRNMAGQ